ncbi:DUF4190 domain-containing protein [Homoserinibacter sp. GY 40078]|uniref:DUF4190 domain-containing protein n=1 Tax=Homoserinibacter sp. GY 40078 TaxID=2603275 RepID=UPI0011C911E0|nr:DUF4190 domain-containing protein [Homoserinibacter sp. GY 40078]TXK17648.1 DUF4190 domain-containing protein [Homoserinibacter sp. GY 40078]
MSDSPAPYAAPSPAPHTNGLAITSFVLGILGFALIPVILGHIALSQIRTRGDGGKVFAIIGLVLGYLGLVWWIIFLVFILPLLFIGAASSLG